MVEHCQQDHVICFGFLLKMSPDKAKLSNGHEVMPCVTKQIHWLRATQGNNTPAGQAYQMALQALQAVATRHSTDINDMILEEWWKPRGP